MRSILALAALALLATAALATNTKRVMRSPLTLTESLRTQMLRRGDWKALAQLHAKQLATSSLWGDAKARFAVNADGLSVRTLIGLPAQRFNMLIDMKSPLSWVTSRTCSPKNCPVWCKESRFCGKVCLPQCCDGGAATTSAPLPTDTPTATPTAANTNAPTEVPTTANTDAPSAALTGALSRVWRHMIGASQNSTTNATACFANNTFSGEWSRSFHKDGRAFIELVEVRDGKNDGATTKAFGEYGVDTFWLGYDQSNQWTTIDHTTFGIVTQIVDDALRNGTYDGILGLGAGRNSDGVRSVLKQGVRNHEFVDEALTIWLAPQSERKTAGEITFGGVDDEHCRVIGSVNVAVNADDFSFAVAGFTLNGANATSLNTTAIIDLNTAEIVVGQSLADALIEATGAQYEKEYDVYFVDCNTRVSVQLSLGSSNNNTLGQDDMQIKLTENELIAHPAPKVCTLNARASTDGTDAITLGRVVAQRYCLHYDLKEESPRVGFYAASHYDN